ncbi:hypothetical protein RCF19_29955 [Rhodococcus qingshengii]
MTAPAVEPTPHELPAILRMHRAGWPGPKIMAFFKMKPLAFQRQFEKALADENAAHRARLPIHSPTVKAGQR